MTWLLAIVAIVLSLGVLAIDPSQLQQINEGISSTYWQTIAYITLCMSALLGLQPYYGKLPIFKAVFSTSVFSFKGDSIAKETLVLPIEYQHYLTPLTLVKRLGTIHTLLKTGGVFLFWLAILCNTLAQRIELIETTPMQPIYIEALVTPIGLSDKPLQMQNVISDKLSPTQNLTSSVSVTQGYRQLVRVSHLTYIENEIGGLHGVPLNNEHSLAFIQNPFIVASPQLPKTQATDISSSLLQESVPSRHKAMSMQSTQFVQTTPFTSANTRLIEKPALPNSMVVMLQSYRPSYAWLNHLAPNQQVRMRLKLSPIERTTNPNEFDEYRWLSTRHAVATADIISASAEQQQTIRQPSFLQSINQFRYQFRSHFLQLIEETTVLPLDTASGVNAIPVAVAPSVIDTVDDKAIALSLLTGDRSLVSSEMTGLYRFAGISHLLAISGTHVLFLAILSAGLVSLLTNRYWPHLYYVLPRWQLKLVVAVVVAFAYALFAGFDVPAVRTALMLMAVGVARYLLAAPFIFKMLLMLAVFMTWQDGFVLWQAGFWLSFIAVAMLVVYVHRWDKQDEVKTHHADVVNPCISTGHTTTLLDNDGRGSILILKRLTVRFKPLLMLFWRFCQLQLWMTIALLPLSLWLFGKVSIWGIVVNLFAIGFFGWVIVPLNLLAGVCHTLLPQMPQVADAIWQFIFVLLSYFHEMLVALSLEAGQTGWLHSNLSLPVLCLLGLMVLPWLLPKGILSRYLSLPVTLILCVLPFLRTVEREDTIIMALDTGEDHLSATLIRSQQRSWLLLSAYPKTIKTTPYITKAQVAAHLRSFQVLGTDKVSFVTRNLYDQLHYQGIHTLTGVIGQTATPELAILVTKLRHDMPISNYWQAGLAAHHMQVKAIMSHSGLTAQSCEAGKSWSSSTSEMSRQFTITAVTGWSTIDDSNVWDCTLLLSMPEPTTLIQRTELGPSSMTLLTVKETQAQTNLAHLQPDLIKHAPLKTHRSFNSQQHSQASSEVSKNTDISVRNKHSLNQEIIVYTSKSLRLGQLWPYLCLAELTNDNLGRQPQRQWLFSRQAVIHKDVIDAMPPKSWHVLSQIQPNETLIESKLYWRQHYVLP